MHNKTFHLTPKARAFFASAISVYNFAFAKSSLAFGAGELYVGLNSEGIMAYARLVKTVLGFILIGICLYMIVAGMLYGGFRFNNYNLSIFLITLIILFIVGLAALVLPIESFENSIKSFLLGIPSFIFHAFFIILYGSIIFWLIALLLKPTLLEIFFMPLDGDKLTHKIMEAQILSCICLAGMAGGIISQLFTTPIVSKPTEEEPVEMHRYSSLSHRFWNNMISIIAALFVSLVIFLLIRAGILKQVEIDTFNVYGVTGFAAVSGYFSKSILERFKKLYEGIMGN